MPVDPNAEIEVTALRSVAPMARGYVKDIRLRWALEEIGLAYRVRLVEGFGAAKSPGRLADQPFGQVPVYKEPGLTLFELGAILIHLGEKDERLLPREPVGRARTISWTFAALNSVEPMLQTLFVVGLVADGKNWRDEATAAVRPFAETRLNQISNALGDRDWLQDRFTIGDLVMIDVLRAASEPELIDARPNLAAYVARGAARPAFQSALAAQLADFDAS